MPHDEPQLLYFAYGSNMSTPRLRDRIAVARAVTTAVLPEHALRFHKAGRDGSAKCDAWHTGRAADAVHGVLFEIPAGAKPRLDACEGLGEGYDEIAVRVTDARGTHYRAFTYRATHIDARLRPRHWYKAHVLHGALEHGLPAAYVTAIRAIEAVDDPSPGNAARELAIYSMRAMCQSTDSQQEND